LGVLVLLLGGLVFTFFFLFVFLFLKLIFLSYLRGAGMSSIIGYVGEFISGERNWGEMFGGYGLYNSLSFFGISFSVLRFFWLLGGRFLFIFRLVFFLFV
jgi:hypothetical protein